MGPVVTYCDFSAHHHCASELAWNTSRLDNLSLSHFLFLGSLLWK